MFNNEGPFTSISVDSSPPASDGFYSGSPPISAVSSPPSSPPSPDVTSDQSSPPTAAVTDGQKGPPSPPTLNTGTSTPFMAEINSPISPPSPAIVNGQTDLPAQAVVSGQQGLPASAGVATSPQSGAVPVSSGAAGQDQGGAPQSARMRIIVFTLELVFLSILLAAAVLYHYHATSGPLHGFQQVFPPDIGPVPLAIPWFGAVGAVVRGLAASYGEMNDPTEDSAYLSKSYDQPRWHISRPFMGAALGIITYIIFLVVLVPSGNTQLQKSDGPILLAFLVGYSDGTFTSLIRRAVDVILGPGQASKSDPNK